MGKAQVKYPAASNGASNLQRSKLRGIWSPLRSVLTMRRWRTAPLAAFAKYSCKHDTWLLFAEINVKEDSCPEGVPDRNFFAL